MFWTPTAVNFATTINGRPTTVPGSAWKCLGPLCDPKCLIPILCPGGGEGGSPDFPRPPSPPGPPPGGPKEGPGNYNPGTPESPNKPDPNKPSPKKPDPSELQPSNTKSSNPTTTDSKKSTNSETSTSSCSKTAVPQCSPTVSVWIPSGKSTYTTTTSTKCTTISACDVKGSTTIQTTTASNCKRFTLGPVLTAFPASISSLLAPFSGFNIPKTPGSISTGTESPSKTSKPPTTKASKTSFAPLPSITLFCSAFQDPHIDKNECHCSDSSSYSMIHSGKNAPCPWTTIPPSSLRIIDPTATPPPPTTMSGGFIYTSTQGPTSGSQTTVVGCTATATIQSGEYTITRCEGDIVPIAIQGPCPSIVSTIPYHLILHSRCGKIVLIVLPSL